MGNIAAYQEGYTDGFADAKKKFERQHGEWKDFIMPLPLSDHHYKMGVICSECNTTWDCSSNYCPYCGARMQAGEEE